MVELFSVAIKEVYKNFPVSGCVPQILKALFQLPKVAHKATFYSRNVISIFFCSGGKTLQICQDITLEADKRKKQNLFCTRCFLYPRSFGCKDGEGVLC